MTPPLTPEMLDEKLKEIRQRYENATADEWTYSNEYLFAGIPAIAEWDSETSEGNKEFIAHARNDIPLLLAHIESQSRRVEELEKKVSSLMEICNLTVDQGVELRRWQDKIRAKIIKCSGAPDSSIDGSPSDSGDPLDYTLLEIWQGFNYVTGQLYVANESIKVKDELINQVSIIAEDTPELNMNNYCEAEVSQLNSAVINIYKLSKSNQSISGEREK